MVVVGHWVTHLQAAHFNYNGCHWLLVVGLEKGWSLDGHLALWICTPCRGHGRGSWPAGSRLVSTVAHQSDLLLHARQQVVTPW
jgi:hypothetical protein